MTHLSKVQNDVVEETMLKINDIKKIGGIKVPDSYSIENAVHAAGLILSQTLDKDEKPVLETCTKESIANALLKMVIEGLDPLKKQCYFNAFENKLKCMRSYQGSIVLAKRFTDIKDIRGHTLYVDDVFEYGFDIATGRKTLIKHIQKIENINLEKIKGAYAISIFNDGTHEIEVMDFIQIKKAWMMGEANGQSISHKDFPDQMAERTVINRLCKKYIDSSTDAVLFEKYGNQISLPENNDNKIVLKALQIDPSESNDNQLKKAVEKEISEQKDDKEATKKDAAEKDDKVKTSGKQTRKPTF